MCARHQVILRLRRNRLQMTRPAKSPGTSPSLPLSLSRKQTDILRDRIDISNPRNVLTARYKRNDAHDASADSARHYKSRAHGLARGNKEILQGLL